MAKKLHTVAPSLFELYNIDESTTSNDHFDRFEDMQDSIFATLHKTKKLKSQAQARRKAQQA